MTHSMKYNTQSCRLVCKKELQPGIYDFTVESREFASKAQPGQFAHLLVPGKTLRRPISICDADPEEGTLRLVFQVRALSFFPNLKRGRRWIFWRPWAMGLQQGIPRGGRYW